MIKAVIAFGLYLSFGFGGMYLLYWMTTNRCETWGDLFTFKKRKRQYEAAIKHGAVACGCYYGRKARKYQTKWNKWETCTKCCGTGAVLTMPTDITLR